MQSVSVSHAYFSLKRLDQSLVGCLSTNGYSDEVSSTLVTARTKQIQSGMERSPQGKHLTSLGVKQRDCSSCMM